MALKKEGPEFDVDDELLLLEPAITFDESLAEEQVSLQVTGKASSLSSKQHKHIDYSRALDATQLYLNEIGFSPLLTPEEEVHFARLAQRGDPAGRRRMIESNLRLVVKIARRYVNRGLSLLDLIEEGNLGLIRAVEKFDPERGALRSYLLAQTHGRSIDLIRSETSRTRREQQEARYTATSGYDLEHEVVDLAVAEGVRQSLASLPEQERVPIQMAYFGGHTYKEVADILNEPEGTVKSRIRSGMKKLRSELVIAGVAGV